MIWRNGEQPGFKAAVLGFSSFAIWLSLFLLLSGALSQGEASTGVGRGRKRVGRRPRGWGWQSIPVPVTSNRAGSNLQREASVITIGPW